MLEVGVLQAVRLKGRVSAEAVAVCVAEPVSTVRAEPLRLADQGFVTGAGTVRITPEGRVR